MFETYNYCPFGDAGLKEKAQEKNHKQCCGNAKQTI